MSLDLFVRFHELKENYNQLCFIALNFSNDLKFNRSHVSHNKDLKSHIINPYTRPKEHREVRKALSLGQLEAVSIRSGYRSHSTTKQLMFPLRWCTAMHNLHLSSESSLKESKQTTENEENNTNTPSTSYSTSTKNSRGDFNKANEEGLGQESTVDSTEASQKVHAISKPSQNIRKHQKKHITHQIYRGLDKFYRKR